MADAPADAGALDPDSVARREFTTTFRGFDQVEVRAFLNSVGAQLRAAADRERALSAQIEDLERRVSAAEEPDEHRLTSMLGEETARILDAARDAATEIRTKAETKTAQLVRDAQDDAHRMTTEAAEVLRLRTAEADDAATAIREAAEAERDRVLAEATAEAERLVAEATAEAERLVAEATELRDEGQADAAAAVEAGRQEGRDMVAEAQVVRERILTDLARRRKAARGQLEQLRAARERLLEAYAVVRRTLDEATTELAVAVPEARLAAESAGRRVDAEDDELSVEDIEAELDAGRFAGLPLLDREDPGEEDAADDSADEVAVADEAAEADEDADADEVEDAADGDEDVEADVVDEDEEPDDDIEAVEPAAGLDEDDLEELDEEAGDGGVVSDLFARIRAEVPDADVAAEADESEDAEVVELAAETAGGESGHPDADEDLDGDAEELGDAEETVLERRDRYTVPLERDLARALKRQLADDENDKLDLIRRMSAKDGADTVLGTLDQHRTPFLAAVRDQLDASAEAGTEFTAEVLADTGEEALQVGLVAVDDLAEELATTLLVPIRDKVAELLEGSEGDDALDGVRACYRQWKGRAGDIAGQFVHTAFNRGVFAAVPEGTMVTWVHDDGVGPCPDGADDALGGAVTKGEEFPTGHLHPPAHASCRCLLVPGVL